MYISSSFRTTLTIFALSLCAALFVPSQAVAADQLPHDGLTLLGSDTGRLLFEVAIDRYSLDESAAMPGTDRFTIPGFTTRCRPGEPALPARKYLIAVPPEGGYRISVQVLEETQLGSHRLLPVPFPELKRQGEIQPLLTERYEIRDEIYNSFTSRPLTEEDPAAYIRHQRVLPLWVNPARYDVSSGELVLITRMRVEVTFASPEKGDGQSRPRPLDADPGWDRILSNVLVNPGAAAGWRTYAPDRPARTDGPRLQPLQGPMMKIQIRKTGMARIRAADLIAQGFPAGETTGDLHLFKRTYDPVAMSAGTADVAFAIEEDPAGVSGVFDANDCIVFYGQRLRDDVLQDDRIEKFSDHNVYWLAPAAGTAMQQVPLARGFISADTAVTSFEVSRRVEEDNYFNEQTPAYSFGEPPLKQDSYYYNLFSVPRLKLPFDVGYAAPGTSVHVRMEITGGDLALTSIRQLILSIVTASDSIPLNTAFVSGNNTVDYTSQAIPAESLDDGINYFSIAPPGVWPDMERSSIEAVLNWFAVDFQSRYRARGNRLTFNTGALAGDTSICVTGLSTSDLRLYEVTDPLAVKECLLDQENFTDTGAGLVLSFRDQIASRKSYILTPFDSIPVVAVEDIERDTPSTIIGNTMESGVDVLVVSHADFLGEMQRWVDYRRAQGYRVLMVDVEDVYDEFNGGVPNAYAVKRFVEYYYRKANASALLLVGDASEDAKRVAGKSGPNFVPTQSYPERINAYPFKEDEVVTTDKWYGMIDNDFMSNQDYYPDLLVGRLPAGDVGELQTMLDKVFMFESPSASDFWRRRMIQVADDAWSGQGFVCYQFGEGDFENGEESNALLIESSIAGGFDVVREYLSTFTDAIHPPPGECVSLGIAKDYTRAHATPDLLAQLAQGASLVSIQAHMNRYLITHEFLFSSSAAVGGDHKRVQNFFKPFIAFGMGCHMSDYAIYYELNYTLLNDVNGDCLSELLLFLVNRGAVATYGSTGFEYLGENNSFSNQIYETFFVSPPTDTMIASDRAQARWIFGEVMTASELLGATRGQTIRYHILGDPLLRIDAGPPRFDVTLDGSPVTSGSIVTAAAGSDTIHVEAVVSDENAIEKFELLIDGVDQTESLVRKALVDTNLTAARKYRLSFAHKLLPKSYDIVLRALQAPDTTAGTYHIAAEFVLAVPLDISFQVNGRRIVDNDLVPLRGDYEVTMSLPVLLEPEELEVSVDDEPVAALSRSQAPDDSTSWVLRFSRTLEAGEHTIAVYVSGTEAKRITVHVSLERGIAQLIPYPNPFVEDTYFVFKNEVEITGGQIDIFTTSGRRIASVPIPVTSRSPGQNAVHWDGRDSAGDEVANGVYLFIATIFQGPDRYTVNGKVARMK